MRLVKRYKHTELSITEQGINKKDVYEDVLMPSFFVYIFRDKDFRYLLFNFFLFSFFCFFSFLYLEKWAIMILSFVNGAYFSLLLIRSIFLFQKWK